MFIAVATLATFGLSCSSDDNSKEEKKDEKQLVLKADKTAVTVGETVKFSVLIDNKAVDGAKITINGETIGEEHVFKKAGTFVVVAKKKGFLDSASVTINVTDSNGKKQLELSTDASEIKIGEEVLFFVRENGVQVKDFKIKSLQGKTVDNNKWIADEAGEFKFIATKEGYIDSKEVVVRVTENEQPEFESFVTLGSKTYELSYGLYGVACYEDGKTAEGKPNYVKAIYTLKDGRKVFRYVYQMYKGQNTDEDYDNAWEEGGVIQGMVFYIEAKNQESSPLNTLASEWLWGDMYTIIDGDIDYTDPDDSSDLYVGYDVSEDGVFSVGIGSTGTYTSPSMTKFNVNYSGVLEGAYVFIVSKPSTNSITNIKAKGPKGNLRAIK